MTNKKNDKQKLSVINPDAAGIDIGSREHYGYKPIDLGFGTRFESGNYSFIAKIPLSFKLLKVFIQKKDPFEIINFIKELELTSDKTKIFDLVDGQKLYDEDHTIISFSHQKIA